MFDEAIGSALQRSSPSCCGAVPEVDEKVVRLGMELTVLNNLDLYEQRKATAK